MRDAVRLTQHRSWPFTTRQDRCATSVYDDCRSSKSSSGRRMANVVLQVVIEGRHALPFGMKALAACSGDATAVRLGQEQHDRAGDGGGAGKPGRGRAALCSTMANGREECASWARCGAGSRVVAEEPSHRLTQRYVDWSVGYQ